MPPCLVRCRHEDSVVKLIDFSLSSFFYTPTDPGGTPDFVAPELLKDQEQYCKVSGLGWAESGG